MARTAVPGRYGARPMKALRSFTVRPSLPPELSALEELALNLRWSWDDQTRDLFRWVDPHLWDASVHDPVRMLGLVDRERLDTLAHDAGFKRFLGEVRDELQRYLDGERWFQAKGDSPLDLVAYFSPEFGIAEAVPQYSGGLGVLAGDHLKSSSDLGVPLVGVGLLYRHGSFRQSLDADGWQQERYPLLDPHVMALTLCDGVRISVDIAGVPLVRRGGRRGRRLDGARPPAQRTARRAVQHGGDGPAAGGPVERGSAAPRRGQPRDVRRPLERPADRRDPDHLHHQRRPCPHLGIARDGRRVHAPRAPRLGRGRSGCLGADLRDARRRAVARPGAGPRAPGH